MKKLGFTLALAFAIFAFPFSAAFATTDHDCSDFKTQEEAQKYFDSKGYGPNYDPERLDADHDGIACENLKSGNSDEGKSGDSGKGTNENNGSSGNKGSNGSKSGSNSSKGGNLPKTATPLLNLALAGVAMMGTGAGMLAIRRKA